MKLQEVENVFYIIPYVNYELKSSEKKEVLLEKLSSSINIVKILSVTKTSSFYDFEGVLYDNEFKVRRNIKIGYSAFLPILSCKIYEEEKNLKLKVNIQFHKYVNIGITIFFLFQLSFLFFNPLEFFLDPFTYLITVLPYCIIISLFNLEAKSVKNKFNEIILPS